MRLAGAGAASGTGTGAGAVGPGMSNPATARPAATTGASIVSTLRDSDEGVDMAEAADSLPGVAASFTVSVVGGVLPGMTSSGKANFRLRIKP